MSEQIRKLLERFRLTPENLSLYETAFTHRSYLNESKDITESNERLEFLGDSVLSLIISAYIFTSRKSDEEGALTNLRAYIVKTESLAKVSKHLQLGEFLKLSKGEEFSGGRVNLQLLANTYEALLGAIFLDLGIEDATQFVHLSLLPLFSEEIVSGPPRDPKSQLQEEAQNIYKISPRYKVISSIGPDHAKQFVVGVIIRGEVIGQGEGHSKQQAEEAAAKQALTNLVLIDKPKKA